MKRRTFLASGGAALVTTGNLAFAQDEEDGVFTGQNEEPFKVLFAPNPNHFQGVKSDEGYLKSLQQAHDLGFRAWEDNNLYRRNPTLQTAIGKFLRKHEMTMGVTVVSVGSGVVFANANEAEKEAILQQCREAVEVAQRVGHKWFTLVPGARDPALPIEPQIKGAAGLIRQCCEIFEEASLIFVLEPLSHAMKGKPVLLETFREGHLLCKEVDHPSCKLLADFYHQQQMAGDLIKNTNKFWDEIAYVQYGDVPGRNQPGTGEINYTNVTQHLVDKGYRGVIGLEHGIRGELSDLIKAYRAIDDALRLK